MWHHSSNWPHIRGKVHLKFYLWLTLSNSILLYTQVFISSWWEILVMVSWNKIERKKSSVASRYIIQAIQALQLQGNKSKFQEQIFPPGFAGLCFLG